MKKIFLVPLLFGLGLTALAEEVHLPSHLNDVLKLSQAHISPAVIQSFINNSAFAYNPSADQILYLREQGVSEDLIISLLTHPAPAQSPSFAVVQPQTPAPTFATISEPQPAQAPTVVYTQPAPVQVVQEYVSAPYYDYYWGPGYWGFGGIWIGPGWRWGGGGFHGGGVFRGGVGFHGAVIGHGGFHSGGGFHGGGAFRGGGGHR